MDPYTIGRLALPVVIGVVAVAALMTMAMGIFTAVKTMAFVQRFLANEFARQKEANRRSTVTINIFPGKRSSKPPMRAENEQ